jgi:hypothetical protein
MGLKLPLFAGLLWLGVIAKALPIPAFLYTQTPRYDAACPERFPRGASIQAVSAGRAKPLIPGFAASADPAVSFDGRRVLFAGKQGADDSWQIWEMPLAGAPPRRLTRFAEDAIAPFYAAGERIVYSRRTAIGFQLETMLLAGSDALRLTYAPGDYLATAVLRDGRILFEGPHPGAAGRDLFTVYLDGSGVETYRCDHRHDRTAGFESASGDILFNVAGRLARFTSARAVEIETPAAPGEFAGRMAEIAPGEMLAAFRPVAGQPFGIFLWRQGERIPEKVFAAEAGDAVQPTLIRSHEIPKRHPSALGNREGANLLCLNVYTSKSRIPRGSVASVRVWALDDFGVAAALGEAPVEKDGSFFVQAPADRGIRFELLDRAGKTVEAEKGWIWARRGEQRVCVGCHAGPERAPENAVPEVLLRRAEATPLLLRTGTARGGSK